MRFDRMLKHIGIAGLMLVLFSLLGCQTITFRKFEKVQSGMNKSEVIDLIGGPNRARRWQGKDRWTYRFPETPEGPQIREILFENGKVVYAGDKLSPRLSADEQDQANTEANAQEEQAALMSENTPQRPKRKDRIDRYIEEGLYGTDPSTEKKKRAPVWEEIH